MPFTGRDGCSPTVDIMWSIKCKGTLITSISTPCNSTLTPVEDLSENGNTLSKINDCVAPVCLSTLTGIFSLPCSGQTNPFDTNGDRPLSAVLPRVMLLDVIF